MTARDLRLSDWIALGGAVVVVLAVVLILFVIGRLIFGFDDGAACHEAGGRWLARYQLCIREEAIIPLEGT